MSGIAQSAKIHSTAIIEQGANIGENVTIEGFCYIGSEVSIGDNSQIAHHSCIYNDTTIGANNRIFAHTVLGSIPQDLKYNGEKTTLIIGDNNTIREFCLVNTGTQGGGGQTTIGNGNLLMSHSHIGHDCIIEDNCIIAPSAMVGGHSHIEKEAIIGGACAVHQFTHIGAYAFLGGGSILTQDLPPYCLAEGNKAQIKALNLVGLRRKLPDEVDRLRKAFKELFFETHQLKTNNLQEKAKFFYENTDSNHIKNLCKFIIDNKRGIPAPKK